MTIDEFLEKLGGCGAIWHLTDPWEYETKTRIRVLGVGRCPIQELGDSHSVVVAAGKLGLSKRDAAEIVAATDGALRHDPALRRRILARCGLEDPA